MNCEAKHVLQCAALYAWIGIVIFITLYFDTTEVEIDPIQEYGYFLTIFLYIWKCTQLLVLPQCIFHLIGFTCFNQFKDKVLLRAHPKVAPFVCFRVVTRGLYPKLVKDNLALNIDTCKRAGIVNYCFEVVTDNSIELHTGSLVREIVVPKSFQSKNGALFKARALQYCLEDGVNRLRDSDYVVHLDEETLLTHDSVYGILNFADEGKHQFGQGVITYANGNIVNWLTTLSDCYRVADDCGKQHAQLSVLHKPIFGWKGSYVVTRYGAERTITWDHGPEGSIAEDTYFAILGMQAGYSFDFVEGEMLEKSPFTTWDFLQQRKRWLEGLLLTVHSKKIKLIYKLPMAMVVYSWALAPLIIAQLFVMPFFPMPKVVWLDIIFASLLAINLYMNVFGVVRSFTQKYRQNIFMLLLSCVGACLTIPYTLVIQVASVFLLIFGPKKEFFIVKKESTPIMNVLTV
ncbi:hypothetical protein PENTCL1PPCAC_14464 [Pristionchus entomophagus]|uniref:Glycosyltransferase 2-like domain-containing protein n=1 Tax=Pristionchus entomophagus TaxID=358040 RepID=A0AAV5TFN9_9BILA|nr:hypothetical protein PENTCL1PPCAC_14464 [Pristionchus entomophagus]